MAKPPQFGSSNDESDAGRDEQQVYSGLKLPIGLLKIRRPNHAPAKQPERRRATPSVSGVDAPSAGAML
jgi:hypothetical protein